MKRKIAIWIVAAILAGILPSGNVSVEAFAVQTDGADLVRGDEADSAQTDETGSEEAGGTSQEGYGLHNPVTDGNGVTTWDCVYFGKYWKEDTNGDFKVDRNDEKLPIKWRVLSVDGDDAFLLADEILDCLRYNETRTDITWETCTLRSWLNGYGAEANKEGKDYSSDNFLMNAFSEDERSDIRITNVINRDDSQSNISDINDTLDQVYLLSLNEATNPVYGFSSDKNKSDGGRAAKTTLYGEKQGVWRAVVSGRSGDAYYWLRSRGNFEDFASQVRSGGSVNQAATAVVHASGYGIRPVLHLNLKGSSEALGANWSYAGTVTAEGGDVRTEPPAETIKPGFHPADETDRNKREVQGPVTDENGVRTWDCVYFGNYWQEDTNGDGSVDESDEKQPIRWRVLSVDGDDAFLLSDQILNCRKYNDSVTDVTWETCTLRSWLNGYGEEVNKEENDYIEDNFLIKAFSDEEQSFIRTTHVVNSDNNEVEAGNDTLDRVYLLSLDEVLNPIYGFSSVGQKFDEGRKAKTTKSAREEGLETSTHPEDFDNGGWWLRSPGSSDRDAACVARYGNTWQCGDLVIHKNGGGVRPALHLNLKGSSEDTGFIWTYAGTVIAGAGDIWAETPAESKKPDTESTAGPTPEGIKTETPTEAPTERPLPLESEKPGDGHVEDYGLHDPSTDENGITTWDSVYFGNYWQEATEWYQDGKADECGSMQPVRWRVLSVDGDDAFLMADKCLDCRKYHDAYEAVTWETCTLRSWLNGYGAEANKASKDYSSDNFLMNVFSEDEQSAIRTTEEVNGDKVYLPSLDEVTNPNYGFSSDESKQDDGRAAQITGYAKGKGAWTSTNAEYAGNGRWWLRSPGNSDCDAARVYGYGSVDRYGCNVDGSIVAVRPVLHLDLSARGWSYAGTVTAKGGDVSIATKAPGGVSTAGPVGSSTAGPEGSSTAGPAGSSTAGPAGSSTAGPEGSSTAGPEGSSTAGPAGSSTAGPAGSSLAGPTGSPNSPETTPTLSDPVSQSSASPVPTSDGRKSSVGRVSSLKLKQKKQMVTASWKKVSGAVGYQICYSTSKKWKGQKQELTRKNKLTIKKLKKKKTYYFRIRAYRKDGAKKIYGVWSNTKKVKIKK